MAAGLERVLEQNSTETRLAHRRIDQLSRAVKYGNKHMMATVSMGMAVSVDSSATGTATTTIAWDSSELDPYGMLLLSSPTEVVVRQTGQYLIALSVRLSPSTILGNPYAVLSVLINGVKVGGFATQIASDIAGEYLSCVVPAKRCVTGDSVVATVAGVRAGVFEYDYASLSVSTIGHTTPE